MWQSRERCTGDEGATVLFQPYYFVFFCFGFFKVSESNCFNQPKIWKDFDQTKISYNICLCDSLLTSFFLSLYDIVLRFFFNRKYLGLKSRGLFSEVRRFRLNSYSRQLCWSNYTDVAVEKTSILSIENGCN